MGQIGNTILYPYDVVISTLDFLTGTDSNDNKKTKSYQIKKLAEIINIVNGGSAVAYHFSDGSNIDLTVLEPGYFFSETNIITPATLTKLHFNKRTIENKDISVFLDKMIASGLFKFKLNNLSNPNNFIYLTPSNTVLSTEYLSFNVATFNNLHSGNLINNADYVLSFDLASNLVQASDPLKLNKGNYTGTGEDLNKEIQDLKNPDVVLKSVTPTIVGLNISTPADSFEWKINQIVFDNTPALSQTLLAASNGFYRKDVLLGTNTNTYLIVRGVEGNESVTPPTVFPQGTIVLGVIDIFGNTTSGFIINDNSKVDVFGNGGVTDYVEVNKLGTSLDIRNATSLTGFTIPSANIQYGKDYYLRNSTGGNLTLRSITGTNGIRFYFPDGDLVVPVNNNVHLKYLSNTEFGGLGYFTLVGISYKDKVDKVAGQGLISDTEKLRLSTVVNFDNAPNVNALSNKVDKVINRSLILDTEITRLAGVSNVDISGKQNTLVSGTNIRTVNGNSLLGSTDLVIATNSGTVTSVTGINGVTVATGTTTPVIGLGAITPTTIVATGAISGTNLSGTNTGDNATNTQYSGLVSNATHTGEVTGDTALTISNNVVTNAKLSQIATNTILGRSTALTGNVENITIGSGLLLSAGSLSATAGGGGTVTAIGVTTANGVSGTSSGGATPNLTISLGAITPTSTNGVLAATMAFNDATSSIQTQINSKSNLASPTFTGLPLAPTATAGTNTTQVATTAFVGSAVSLANSNVVTLTGTQNISGAKVFIGGSTTTTPLNAEANSNVIGAALFVSKDGGGSALLLNKSGTPRGVSSDLITMTSQGDMGTGFFIRMTTNSTFPNADFISATNNTGANVFIVNKLGTTTATSFVNSTAPATNALLAGGTTLANPISGTGTSNFLPKFTGSGTVGNSIISESGSEIQVSGSIKATSAITNSTIVIVSDRIEEHLTNSNSAGLAFNFFGYLGGSTLFRDYTIFNGKTVSLFKVTGSSGVVTINNLSGTGLRSIASDATGNVIARTTYPIFENNAAAVSLAIGEFYRTSTGILMVRF